MILIVENFKANIGNRHMYIEIPEIFPFYLGFFFGFQ